MPSILVVEDEPAILELLKVNLVDAGYDVRAVPDAEEAQVQLSEALPDLLLLDWMLPGKSGLVLAKELRGAARTRELPIIMITARTDEADKVAGLEAWVDDYVTKPFSPRELVARVEAVLRRVPPAEGEVIVRGAMRLDAAQRSVTVAGRTIDLTPSELSILRTLALRPGRVVSRARLVEMLPGGGGDTMDRTVDVHVRNLRRKIELDCIRTVVGAGYRFVPP